MSTRSISFNDDDYPSTVERGLIGRTAWNSGDIGFHLEDGDFDENGRNDWDENGARQAMEQSLQLWANVADLNFFETTRANANLVERINDVPDSSLEEGRIILGRHYLPGGNSGGGLRRFEQSDGEYNLEARGWNSTGLTQGGSAFSTIIHEIGHALGLEHPFDDDLFSGSTGASFDDFANFGLNQGIYSVMTYNRGWVGLGGRSPSEGYGHTGTPLALDIAAVQAMYGANMDHATGNDTYVMPTFNASGTFFSSIWDAGGTDTIVYDGFGDANVFLDAATIDDSPTGGGLLSYSDGIRGGMTIARGTVIENARTAGGNDVVGGNDANNLIETGAGDDIVMGLGGDDTIMGGDGDDIIIGDYQSVETFGIALTAAPAPYLGPELPAGLSQGDGLITAGSSTGNTTSSRAVDVSGDFALRALFPIEGGEELYSETIDATSGTGFGWYTFTIAEDARITIDIDGAWGGSASASGSFDSYIELLDSRLQLVTENDDLVDADAGSTSATSNGGQRNLDSFIDATLDAGTYYIKVGQYSDAGPAALSFGSTYQMHVVADGYAVEVPSLPTEAGFAQFGYYYETPDFSDAIGGYNRRAAGDTSDRAQTDKDGNPGHWHVTEDGGRVWHAEPHGPDDGEMGDGSMDALGGEGGCGCSACQDGQANEAFASTGGLMGGADAADPSAAGEGSAAAWDVG